MSDRDVGPPRTPGEQRRAVVSASAQTPELSVLMVLYRNPELTRAAIASVLEQTTIPFELIAVDNASGDGTPELVEREFPGVRLIRSEENLGFAGANNLAAQHARADHVVLLNPDTVVHERALERLLEFARSADPDGLYGGRTLRPDGTLDPSSCWGPQTLWSLTCFATGLSTAFRGHPRLDPESLGRWPRDSVRDVGVVTGCLALTSRRTWEQLGGFDPRFFMYGEDADLSLRARQAGHRVAITPAASITHVVGASSSRSGAKMTQVLRARATLLRKHERGPRRLAGLALLQAGVALRAGLGAVRSRLTGAPPPFWAEVWAARAAWRAGYSPAAPVMRMRSRP